MQYFLIVNYTDDDVPDGRGNEDAFNYSEALHGSIGTVVSIPRLKNWFYKFLDSKHLRFIKVKPFKIDYSSHSNHVDNQMDQ